MTDITDELRRSGAVCLFDQHGTVVDMQTGLRRLAGRRQEPPTDRALSPIGGSRPDCRWLWRALRVKALRR